MSRLLSVSFRAKISVLKCGSPRIIRFCWVHLPFRSLFRAVKSQFSRYDFCFQTHPAFGSTIHESILGSGSVESVPKYSEKLLCQCNSECESPLNIFASSLVENIPLGPEHVW